MLGSGVDLQTELAKIPTKESFYPPPTNFTLIQTVNDTTTQTKTVPVPSNSVETENPEPLPSWMIAVICVACIAIVVTIVATMWLVRNLRHNKKAEDVDPSNASEKSPEAQAEPHVYLPPTPGFMENHCMSSVSSPLPVMPAGMHGRVASTRSFPVIQSPSTSRSLHDFDPDRSPFAIQEARTSSSILSSTDALMIADTFRHFMRKPEWTEQYYEDDDDITEEIKRKPDEDEFSHEPEVEKRRRLSTALLRKQLAEEGTDVRCVEKFSGRLKDRTSQEDTTISLNK
ncbi:hypothetical protein DFQ29_001255 [Apophysomyces sp. BC1021]|nr:hypothetical protein DFQ29_001255 [Apophysomyces sp. BC1021]